MIVSSWIVSKNYYNKLLLTELTLRSELKKLKKEVGLCLI